MMTQDKETLREAIIGAIGDIDAERHVDGYAAEFLNGTTDLSAWEREVIADAAIATMFERLRTPSETVLDAGWSSFENAVRKKKPWHEVMASALHGALTAFQQENSDER